MPIGSINIGAQTIQWTERLSARLPNAIAHRGGWGPKPQNSLENYADAIRAGVDALEVDVTQTKDGVLVLRHDPEAPPGPTIDGIVTYDDDPQRLLGPKVRETNFADLPAGTPTWEQFLDLVTDRSWQSGATDGAAMLRRLRVNVELKDTGMGPALLHSIDRRGLRIEDFPFSSYNTDAISEIKRLRPDAIAGVLGANMTQHNPGFTSIDQAARIGADFVAVSISRADAEFLRRAHEHHLPVITYTPWALDDASVVDSLMADPRIAGVIGNQRERLVDARYDLMLTGDLAPREPVGEPWVDYSRANGMDE